MLSNHLILCCPLVSSDNTTLARVVKNLPANAGDTRDAGLIPDSIAWSRKWHPTLVFLPAKFHGQWSLVGYSPWGHREPDMAEQLNTTQQQSYRRPWLTSLPWGQALLRKPNLSSEPLFRKQQVLVPSDCLSNFRSSALPCVLTSKELLIFVVDSKSCWFFSQFSSTVRTKWQLPSSLLAKPSTIFWFVSGFLCMEITLFLCSQIYQFTYCLQILNIVYSLSLQWS